MRVRIERANLLKALNHVHRVVERRNTIPILANVLLQAEGDELSLKATDLDMEIVDRVPAAVEQGGREHRPRPHALRHRAKAARRGRDRARYRSADRRWR